MSSRIWRFRFAAGQVIGYVHGGIPNDVRNVLTAQTRHGATLGPAGTVDILGREIVARQQVAFGEVMSPVGRQSQPFCVDPTPHDPQCNAGTDRAYPKIFVVSIQPHPSSAAQDEAGVVCNEPSGQSKRRIHVVPKTFGIRLSPGARFVPIVILPCRAKLVARLQLSSQRGLNPSE